MNTEPLCPVHGYVMCQVFRYERINNLAERAIPTGEYVCYHCSVTRGILSLEEARMASLDDLRADIIRSAARGQGPTFIAAKLDMLITIAKGESK